MVQADESSTAADESIQVLCVAANAQTAEVMGVRLERADSQITTVTATAADALGSLQDGSFDCVVSEYHLDDIDGLVLLEAIRASNPDLPVVLFATERSPAVASGALTTGATEYVEQTDGIEQYDLLVSRLRTAVERHRQHEPTVPSADRARTALESAVDPVVISVDGTCVYANEAARSLHADTLTGQPIDDILGIDGATIAAVERGKTRPQTVQADAGSTPVTVTVRRVDWGDQSGVVCIYPPTDDRGRERPDPEPHDEMFEAVFATAPAGVLVVGPDGTVLTTNEQFGSLWRIDTSALENADLDLTGSLLSDAVDEPESFTERFAGFSSLDEPHRAEISLADGRLLEQYAVPLETDDGDRLGTAVHYRDLSEQSSADVREPVFDQMTDAFCLLDDDWEFTYVNDHATELTDRTRAELLGTTLWETFPGLVGTELEAKYRDAAETGTRFTTETYYEPLGKYLEIRVFPAETGLKVYFRDISHRRAIERELRQTIDELEALYELTADQDSSFETRRRRLLQVGTEYFDLPYGFISKIDDGEQLIAEAVGDHALLQPGESCALEQSYCRKTVLSESGILAVEGAAAEGWEADAAYETFELGTYIGAKLLVDDELYGTLCFASTEPRGREFSDSERTMIEVMARWLSYEYNHQTYQQQLEEQNDQLERFASMVSHDLRNPLNIAMTKLDLASMESDSDHLEAVADAHERMAALIDDILLLARQDGEIEDKTDLNLGAVARQAWCTVETGSAALTVESDRVLSADKSRLVQVFENLFRNAVEHGSTGPDSQARQDAVEHGSTSTASNTRQDAGSGASEPSVADAPEDAVEHGASAESEDGLSLAVGTMPGGFYVEDDGVGIPAEDRERIFEEGVSDSSEGTGLGLSIVAKLVDAHGWEITVTESESGGARFEITGVE